MKLLEQDRQVRENAAAPTDIVPHKNASRIHWEMQQRSEEKRTKVLKKEQKSRKRRMRTSKGPKGRNPPSPQHTFARKEKESCEERKHRNEPFRQPHSRRHNQKVPNCSHCLRESCNKSNPQAEERRQNKNPLSTNPQKGWKPQAQTWKRQGATAPGVRLRIRTLRIARALSEKNNSKNLSERPQREEKAERKRPNKDRRVNHPRAQRRVHIPQRRTKTGRKNPTQARPPHLTRTKIRPERRILKVKRKNSNQKRKDEETCQAHPKKVDAGNSMN